MCNSARAYMNKLVHEQTENQTGPQLRPQHNPLAPVDWFNLGSTPSFLPSWLISADGLKLKTAENSMNIFLFSVCRVLG